MRKDKETVEDIVHRLDRFSALLHGHKTDIYPGVREHYRAAYQECLYKLGSMNAHAEFMLYSNQLLRYDVEVTLARETTNRTPVLTKGFPEHNEEEEPWEAGA
jgi:hypothetical protein